MQKIITIMLAAGFLAASSVVQAQSQPPLRLPQSPVQVPSTIQPLRRLPFTPVVPHYPSIPDLPPVFVQPQPSARVFLGPSPMTLEIKGPALLLMRPDNMTCLVPDLSGVERMPVKRLKNINPKDSMPNRLRVIPLMPGPDIRMVPPATHK